MLKNIQLPPAFIQSYRAAMAADLPGDAKIDPFWAQMFDVRDTTQELEERTRLEP